jgi:hypothetical protein
MEPPVYLREDSYKVIQHSTTALDDTELVKALVDCGYDVPQDASRSTLNSIIMDAPSRYLVCRCDLLSRPDLLMNLFIECNDDELDAGHTYLIDREAAAEIAAGDATIMLRSGNEGALVPRTRIERELRNGCLIDYRELKQG